MVCDKINEVRPFTHTLNTEHTEVTLGNFRTMKREAPLSHKLDDPFEELGGDLKRPGFVVWAVYCERKLSPIVRRTNLRTSLVTEV